MHRCFNVERSGRLRPWAESIRSARSLAAHVPFPSRGYRKSIRRSYPAGLCPEEKWVCLKREVSAQAWQPRVRPSIFRTCVTSGVALGSTLRDVAPNYLGDPNDLENSEDSRSAGGHGNQHVRLRCAQIDGIEAICPAPAANCCFEPWQASCSRFRFTISDISEVLKLPLHRNTCRKRQDASAFAEEVVPFALSLNPLLFSGRARCSVAADLSPKTRRSDSLPVRSCIVIRVFLVSGAVAFHSPHGSRNGNAHQCKNVSGGNPVPLRAASRRRSCRGH